MQRQRSPPAVATCLVFLFAGLTLAAAQTKPPQKKTSGQLPTPSQFLGFEIGADQTTSYFKALVATSPRVEIEVLGKTTLGEEMIMGAISSEDNLRNKAKYKEIARKLADPRGLSQQQIDALAHEGKSIFLLTCNIHSTEIGSFNIPRLAAARLCGHKPPGRLPMPLEIAAFFDGPIAFQTSAPAPDVQRSVIAWYPDSAKDILVSGYAHGTEKLERRAAVVSFTKGKGKIVMFGFRVQHRAQTEGTSQMLFNAIQW